MYNNLLKIVGFPVIERLTDIDFYKSYRKINNAQWKTPNELEQQSWNKLALILNYSYKNVTMYRDKFQEAGLKPEEIRTKEDLLKLPITTKNDFRKNYPTYCISKAVDKSRWIEDQSSGSTGEPFIFLKDKNAIEKEIASNMMFFEWAGLKMGMKNIRIWGQFRRKLQIQLWERFIRRRLTLDGYDMLQSNLNGYIQKILDFKPVSILSYTSSAVKLSKYILNCETNFKFDNLSSIIVTAETLTESDRKLIEKAFNCEVFNLYGSREILNIAQECEMHQGLHVNTENVYLEIVKNGAHVLPGEKGEVVITDLNNYVMPFIRYSIGDIAIAGDTECLCKRGFPIIKSIEGRVTDFIELPSGENVSFFYFNSLLKPYRIYFKQYQIIQICVDQLLINIIPTKKYHNSIGKEIIKDVKKGLNHETVVELNLVDEIPTEKSGKTKTVIKYSGN